MKYYYYIYEYQKDRKRYTVEAVISSEGLFPVIEAKDLIEKHRDVYPFITFAVEISQKDYDELIQRFNE